MLTIAGLRVVLLAPATGIWVDGPHRRRTALAVLTGLVVAMTSAMSLIRADYHYLWPGLVLLACTAACSDLATVPYNAMLRQLSTGADLGPISGLGSAAGYFGSVLLLLILYLGFIHGDGDTRGLLGLAVADGQHGAGRDRRSPRMVRAVRARRCWSPYVRRSASTFAQRSGSWAPTARCGTR